MKLICENLIFFITVSSKSKYGKIVADSPSRQDKHIIQLPANMTSFNVDIIVVVLTHTKTMPSNTHKLLSKGMLPNNVKHTLTQHLVNRAGWPRCLPEIC